MNLQAFHQKNLFDATHHLFEQLGIALNSNTRQSLQAKDVLKDHYKQNGIFNAIAETYFSGIIDRSLFDSMLFDSTANSFDKAIEKADQTYEGLLLFSLTLHQYPTRTEIAELVRAFNRTSQKMPVALLLHYTYDKQSHISLALSERFKYLQHWRQGEKVGKIIILRDIRTQNPHAGHLRILKDLSIVGKNIRSFNDLHKHWLTVLDIKILNKTFYNELACWFYWAMDKVKFPDDAEKDTEKRNAENLIRLITRFIFVWFMKEKKLIPQEVFNKTYIDQILNYKDKTNSTYYKAILQNLFFATLNTLMKKDDHKSRIFIDEAKKHGYINDGYLQQGFYRYSRFIKDKEKFLKLFEQIPFLNGGLFDCLDTQIGKKEIRIDGFSDNPKNEERLKIPDELFFTEKELKVDLSNYLEDGKNKTVTGLITLLNKYIFTVAENTPIEEDVALDPELLGNVFENLLGAYLPESASTARKASGSYYTPKEIVNYMVDESLVYYFQTYFNRNDDEFLQHIRSLLSYDTDSNPFQTQPDITTKLIDAIESIKILDPACGSGAFLMALLNKLTHLLHKLDPENRIWKNKLLDKIPPEIREETEKSLENKSVDYIRKLGLIENCIYGVDIQTIAIQISKLRFFLSLLIEQKIDDTKPNRDIRALPNLETKFVAANTLIALNTDARGLAHNEEIEKLEHKLFTLREELFYANSRQRKLKLQEQEKATRQTLQQVLQSIGLPATTTEQIASFDPFNQNQSANWFDPEWMFGIKDGFDIVIGNPPYIQLQRDGGFLAKRFANLGFETFERTGDIYSLFYEQGIKLLKRKGTLAYITSNKWMRAGYGKSTRAFFLKHNPIKLLDLGSGVFGSATVDTNILIIQKEQNQNQLQAIDLSKNKTNTSFDNLPFIALKNLSEDSWTISNPIEQQIREKIERIGKPLKDWDIQINRGVLTGYNKAFIIDGATKEKLIAEDPKSAEILKPILRGRDIKRYKAEFADLWLINSHNGVKGKFPRIDVVKNYPAIYKHLRQYEKELVKRQDKGDHWTNLRNCAYIQDFEKEKIIFQEMVQFSSFVFDKEDKYFCLDTGRIITGKNLQFLISIFNSKLFFFAVKKFYGGGGLGETGVRMKHSFFENFVLKEISQEFQAPFTALVDQILAKKAKGADTAALEQEIDELVYGLYGLTAEEIAVVEGR